MTPTVKEYVESRKTWLHKFLDRWLDSRTKKLEKEYYEKFLRLGPWE